MLSNWFHSHFGVDFPFPLVQGSLLPSVDHFCESQCQNYCDFQQCWQGWIPLSFIFKAFFWNYQSHQRNCMKLSFEEWCRAWLKSFRSGTYKNFIGVLLDFNNYHTSKPMSPCENILRITRLWKGGCSSLKGSPLNDNKILICYENNPLSLIL